MRTRTKSPELDICNLSVRVTALEEYNSTFNVG